MTEDRLTAIQARVDAAQPPPWVFAVTGPRGDDGICFDFTDWHRENGGEGFRFEQPTEDDIDFIAHAREDIPFLLAEVRRYREALERIERLDPAPGITTSTHQHLARQALQGDTQP